MVDTVDIEAPGASEAALKAAIQELVLISTTTISVPVNYVDITLPSGYSAFRLVFRNVAWPQQTFGHVFQGAFSRDGGTTWIENATVDADFYYVERRVQTAGVEALQSITNGVLEIGYFEGGSSLSGEMVIMPGSASFKPTVFTNLWTDAAGAANGFMTQREILDEGTGRVDALRIAPFSSGTLTSPEVTDFIGSGAIFSLYGVL
jgi:hypothetical protein